MKTQHSAPQDSLVPIAAAAAQFGYRDPQHFREVAAPRLGLSVLKDGARWFIAQSSLDGAIAKLKSESATLETR